MAVRVDAFRKGLRELGYVEGKNIGIEYRYAEGRLDRLSELATDLVRIQPEVIVTAGPQATDPAKKATETIPIVMAYDSDPVGAGFVSSLARPGGNVTGLTSMGAELSGKRLELLMEVVPKLSRVAVLWNATVPGSADGLKDAEIAARSLTLKLQALEVRSPNDIDDAFRAARKNQAEALMTASNPITFTHRKRVSDLAVKMRLPTIHGQIQFADAGALIVYGPNDADMYRRAATYVDKILKGAKPAELPVEQPVKFDLVININTAKQIGLTIPPNVLARADRVIR
jgi:putative ABC transport system substrate-binding protein